MFRNKDRKRNSGNNGTNAKPPTSNKKPEFVVVGNLYDNLRRMADEYGFERVILHLGQVAHDTMGRDLAMRIWSTFKLTGKVERTASDDD